MRKFLNDTLEEFPENDSREKRIQALTEIEMKSYLDIDFNLGGTAN